MSCGPQFARGGFGKATDTWFSTTGGGRFGLRCKCSALANQLLRGRGSALVKRVGVGRVRVGPVVVVIRLVRVVKRERRLPRRPPDALLSRNVLSSRRGRRMSGWDAGQEPGSTLRHDRPDWNPPQNSRISVFRLV